MLNLFATNTPSKIIKFEVLPGISDHDTLAIQVEKVNELEDELSTKFESSSIDDLRETSKGKIHSVIDTFVPCKLA